MKKPWFVDQDAAWKNGRRNGKKAGWVLRKTVNVTGQQEPNYTGHTFFSHYEINVVSMGLEVIDNAAAELSFIMLPNEMKRRDSEKGSHRR
jgi:hypothetical protein